MTIQVKEFSTSFVWNAKEFDKVLRTKEGYYLFSSIEDRRTVYRALRKGLTFAEALKPPVEVIDYEEVVDNPTPEEKQELSLQQLREFQRSFSTVVETVEKEEPAEEKPEIDQETGLLTSYSTELVKRAKDYLIKLKDNRNHQMWLSKQYPWQQMLVLFRVQTNIDLLWITVEEWESKKISKEHQKEFGLKSPKLSKALSAFGLTQKQISTLLSTVSKEKVDTAVLRDKESAYEQGNSIHYSSCQATDSRAVWGGGSSYCRVEEDAEMMGTELFIWVVGEGMSVNGEGYKARAKLRVLYNERECETVAGLYVDRPYGQHRLLLDNFEQLEEWWETECISAGRSITPIYMPPVWQRDDGAGNDFQRQYGNHKDKNLYCPSACYGYQDTMTRGVGGYNFLVRKNEKESLITQAYKTRTKIAGVYMSALSEVEYNPQKGLSAPVITLPEARYWDELDYRFFADFYQATGKRPQNIYYDDCTTRRHWEFEVEGVRYLAIHDPEDDQDMAFHSLRNESTHYAIWTYGGEEFFNLQYRDSWVEEHKGYYVVRNIPEFGYEKAWDIPFSWDEKNKELHVERNYVTREMEEEGIALPNITDWVKANSDCKGFEILHCNEEQVKAGFCPPWPAFRYEGGFTTTPYKCSNGLSRITSGHKNFYIHIYSKYDLEVLKELEINGSLGSKIEACGLVVNLNDHRLKYKKDED